MQVLSMGKDELQKHQDPNRPISINILNQLQLSLIKFISFGSKYSCKETCLPILISEKKNVRSIVKGNGQWVPKTSTKCLCFNLHETQQSFASKSIPFEELRTHGHQPLQPQSRILHDMKVVFCYCLLFFLLGVPAHSYQGVFKMRHS